jgi:NAD-dependent SIR2 family protein deacetylase
VSQRGKRALTTVAPGPPADNFYCHTCHINFQQEKLAESHQKKGVGCATCHGESERHSSDEDGITPPDVIFAKSMIETSCTKCHPKQEIVKLPGHKPLYPGAASPTGYCTECHGKHVLVVRTRRWDKVTRQLIADDGVRMVGKPPGKAD